MIGISNYSLSEKDTQLPGEIGIRDLITLIGINGESGRRICSWWEKHRVDKKIYLLPFKTQSPIVGCFIEEGKIAINSKQIDGISPEMILFVLLHESRHSDQSEEYRKEYFQTVVDDDKESFRKIYKESESDANVYALSIMNNLGFSMFSRISGPVLRRNEEATEEIYSMMRSDILRYRPFNFTGLIVKQILG
jgi:hypothetical protein